MATLYVDDGYLVDDYVQTDVVVFWGRKEIFIPKFASVLIQTNPREIRQLDLDAFRLTLKGLEDSSDGMAFVRTHTHNTTVSIGGAVLARVIEIINGYTVTFEDGPYAINLVGANSNVGDVVNVNAVSVRSANSAGLQDLNSLQAASFGGTVTLDSTSPHVGTIFPVGTTQYPINNTTDGLQIATERGLVTFDVPRSEVLSNTNFGVGYVFAGTNPIASDVVVEPSASVDNCEFINIRVNGALGNFSKLTDCDIEDITFVNGIAIRSGLRGTIVVTGGIQSTFTDCFDGIANPNSAPVIDMGGETVGGGGAIAMHRYSGSLVITNATEAIATASTFTFASGSIVFDSSVEAGTYVVYGNAVVVDNSTGTALVIDQTMTADVERISVDIHNMHAVVLNVQRYDTNRTKIDKAAFTLTVYADDGTTPITIYDLKDSAGVASVTEIFERVPR